MVFIVEMFGGRRGTETHRSFSLHGSVWPQLRQVAVAHGWKPLGTCLLPGWKVMQDLSGGTLGPDVRYPDSPPASGARFDATREKWAALCRSEGRLENDYDPPDDYGDCRYVCAEDARGLATALLAAAHRLRAGELDIAASAQPTLIAEDMTQATFERVNSPVSPALLEELAAFLSQGGFGFLWDS